MLDDTMLLTMVGGAALLCSLALLALTDQPVAEWSASPLTGRGELIILQCCPV